MVAQVGYVMCTLLLQKNCLVTVVVWSTVFTCTHRCCVFHSLCVFDCSYGSSTLAASWQILCFWHQVIAELLLHIANFGFSPPIKKITLSFTWPSSYCVCDCTNVSRTLLFSVKISSTIDSIEYQHCLHFSTLFFLLFSFTSLTHFKLLLLLLKFWPLELVNLISGMCHFLFFWNPKWWRRMPLFTINRLLLLLEFTNSSTVEIKTRPMNLMSSLLLLNVSAILNLDHTFEALFLEFFSLSPQPSRLTNLSVDLILLWFLKSKLSTAIKSNRSSE